VSRELQSLAVSCVCDDAEVFAAAVHLAMCEAARARTVEDRATRTGTFGGYEVSG
jgi:hypothetical protein